MESADLSNRSISIKTEEDFEQKTDAMSWSQVAEITLVVAAVAGAIFALYYFGGPALAMWLTADSASVGHVASQAALAAGTYLPSHLSIANMLITLGALCLAMIPVGFMKGLQNISNMHPRPDPGRWYPR